MRWARSPAATSIPPSPWASGSAVAAPRTTYILAQLAGACAAAAVLYAMASGQAGFDAAASGFASTGHGEHSPALYSLRAAMVSELVVTALSVITIHGATDKLSAQGFAPLAIGLSLTIIHLISIPVTHTSVNPARSTGVALFQGGWAVHQLWCFWPPPMLGGTAGGGLYRLLLGRPATDG